MQRTGKAKFRCDLETICQNSITAWTDGDRTQLDPSAFCLLPSALCSTAGPPQSSRLQPQLISPPQTKLI